MHRYRGTRRDFLKAGAAAAAGTVLPSRLAMAASSPTEMSAVEAVAAMRDGDISAEAYARALLDRCQALGGLNAFITLDRERVLEDARSADLRRASGQALGALHGLPLPVKDSIDTADYRTTSGTNALREFRPARDAAVMTPLRSAGALVLGKTNIHELSYGWTSNNAAFGPVRNPYDRERIPGGSTGGTAAAIAARMAPAGLAEDTNGSIRIPAALSGICGLRPTTGRWPQRGVMPITPLFDAVGPHARTVADLALLDGVVTGNTNLAPASGLRGVRLAISPAYYLSGLHPGTQAVMQSALARLRDAGAEIVEAEVPDLAEMVNAMNFQIQTYDTAPSIRAYLKDHGTDTTFEDIYAQMSPGIRFVFDNFSLPGGQYYPTRQAYEAARRDVRPRLQAAFRRYFQDHGVQALVFPAALCPATKIGEDAETEWGGEKKPIFLVYSRNVAPGNCASLPGLVLPGGLTAEGLPVGIEFDAPIGKDRELLGLGFALEQALGPIPAPSV
jgi:Asp-tRNA(Asn)/Glu-tRNA(Gln) amidotransferase A subunit family amidase